MSCSVCGVSAIKEAQKHMDISRGRDTSLWKDFTEKMALEWDPKKLNKTFVLDEGNFRN
jgi:hypothetical protein